MSSGRHDIVQHTRQRRHGERKKYETIRDGMALEDMATDTESNMGWPRKSQGGGGVPEECEQEIVLAGSCFCNFPPEMISVYHLIGR